MIIDTEHLRAATDQNIHLVRWPNKAEQVEAAVREAAANLDFHLAILDGKTLTSEEEILNSLGEAFDFPRRSANPNWNAAADFLGDLSWLLEPPMAQPPRRGVIALLRDPEPLMRANLLQFSVLLDTLGERSQSVMSRGFPYQIVVGPLPMDAWYESFLGLLKVSRHFCDACLMVDGDYVDNEP